MGKTGPRICEEGGSGIWFPVAGEGVGWPPALKVCLYFLGLVWSFMAVSIIAEVFMDAIERVTSKKIQVVNKTTGKKTTVKVWNDTVANLTLMALGSSAPEILLNVIELLGAGFYSGSLGASTIVGSAAFNLLIITAVCILAIPSGEVRKIKDLQVFGITASFSLFAYLWLIVILVPSTKDVVEIWEGVVTFLCFPLLVAVAYLADIGTFGRRDAQSEHIDWSEVTPAQMAEMAMAIRAEHGDGLTDVQVLALLRYKFTEKVSRMQYRLNASRQLTGGKVNGAAKTDKMGEKLEQDRKTRQTMNTTERSSQEGYSRVQFAASSYTVLESSGVARLWVERTGDISKRTQVDFAPRSGGAVEGKDFQLKVNSLCFEKGVTRLALDVEILDDDVWEEAEEFAIEITGVSCPDKGTGPEKGERGERHTATVVIVDDDIPGVFVFKQEELSIQDSFEQKELTVTVQRKNGGSGAVTCSYQTEDDSAKQGMDYLEASGTLEFQSGQMEAPFQVTILPKGKYEGTERFRINLSDATGGASFDESTDGGSSSCILTVWILADDSHKSTTDYIMANISPNWDSVKLGNDAWKDQFVEAMWCGGCHEEQKQADWFSVISHYIVLPWKLLFATVPPKEFCGGWLCFCCSLVMIAVVTIVIGDLAGLLGCSLGIADSITGITLVALGTSLPDTFASKQAAVQDPYADASIGNVTGSNSVNVYLGIGLPWMIGAIFWRVSEVTEEWRLTYPSMVDTCPNGCFVVSSQGLDVSVSVFSSCAVICFGVLLLRRCVEGGELGGSTKGRWLTAAMLVLLWVTYIGASIAYELSTNS